MAHPEAAKARQAYVLRRMAEDGYITAAQADAEIARPIAVAPPEPEPPGASYADVVRRYLDDRYGPDRVETDGLVVKVAMDPAMQRHAEAALEADLRLVDRRQGWRGPLLTLTPEQLAAALPAWRERLAAAAARGGPLLVWDLSSVDADELDPGGRARRGRPAPHDPGPGARRRRAVRRAGHRGRRPEGHASTSAAPPAPSRSRTSAGRASGTRRAAPPRRAA